MSDILKRLVVVAIIVLVLLLSLMAGLLTAHADTTTTYTVYLPFVLPPPRSKVGIAPGGYVTGDLDRLSAAWSYRWNGEPFTDTVPEWVDMVWSSDYLSVPMHNRFILEANEPDLVSQANMTATQLAVMQRTLEEMYPDKQLISPACSQSHPDCVWDAAWEYERLYGQRPRWTGIALHYYRWSESMPLVSQYVRRFRADELAHGWNVPLWLTETGACGVDEVATLRDVAQAANELDYLARVAWYKLSWDIYDPNHCSSLLNADRTLTDLGREYLRYTNIEN